MTIGLLEKRKEIIKNMGTTKCGRYIRTNGANNYANDYAVIHSNEGTYRKAFGKNPRLRLQSGGHGETGIKELEKYGIKYNIIKTYSNGVRVGNIPDHYNKKKRKSINQAWFPQNWKSKDIRRAGNHVANIPKNRNITNGIVWGVYKGVRVGVMKNGKKISTIFPDSNQTSILRRKNK